MCLGAFLLPEDPRGGAAPSPGGEQKARWPPGCSGSLVWHSSWPHFPALARMQHTDGGHVPEPRWLCQTKRI